MTVVWITGASSGLGLHTAEALRAAGYRVIAGARSFALPDADGGKPDCLPLDVTNDESMDAFAARALALAGPPDVLVNCAGVLNLGACETYAAQELRQVMDTNFFGQVSMIQRALPLMRERGKGRIVNFSSINGLLGIPFEGAYAASKHAVEGFSECLALEVGRLGVEVMLVEPGDHRSGSAKYRRRAAAMAEASPYARHYAQATAVIAQDEANGSDPDTLGRRIVRALQKKRLPRRLRVAKADQHLAVFLHDAWPQLFESVIDRYYRREPSGK